VHERRGLGQSAAARAWGASEFGGARLAGSAVLGRGVTVHVARELGFCYGVERAVDYALQTRLRFPERRVHLTGPMIHNPHVNGRLAELGIGVLAGDDPARFAGLGPDDVVLLPAFGCPQPELERLQAQGCLIVDTTCGSVLVVWKHVERWARRGFTTLLHGKVGHEETRATCSRVDAAGGRWLVVRDLREADRVCQVLRGLAAPASLAELVARAGSAGFDPTRDLERLGCANQTTMLATESVEVAARVRAALEDRHGATDPERHFTALDTICSATQDRQDALRELLEQPLDLLLVLGGFDSSNTGQLARIGAAVRPTYHVDEPGCLLSARAIRHQPAGGRERVVSWGWLPAGKLRVGITAGASTPPGQVDAVIARLLALRRVKLPIARRRELA